MPILAEVGGMVRFEDIVEGETLQDETDAAGHTAASIIEHKGDLHPQIIIEDDEGKILDFHYMPEQGRHRGRRRAR